MEDIPHAQVVQIDGVYLQGSGQTGTTAIGVQASPSGATVGDGSVDVMSAVDYLTRNGWPAALQDTLIAGLKKTPKRFIIVDDSGSMSTADGHLLHKKGNGTKIFPCSRWEELTETMRFHAGLAEAARAPTEFRLLNGSLPILVGDGPKDDGQNLMRALTAFEQSPGGGTPLCRHIHEVVAQIRSMEYALRASGQKAVLVIATDGESSDGDIAMAMRPLQSLPVWVVIRLCTDDNKICDYWNNIDGQLELEMDVLDDLFGESEEVSTANPWLTYGEPLHRLREFGITLKEVSTTHQTPALTLCLPYALIQIEQSILFFCVYITCVPFFCAPVKMDLLDEAKLSSEQMRTVCTALLGGKKNDYPRPEIEWRLFKVSSRCQPQ